MQALAQDQLHLRTETAIDHARMFTPAIFALMRALKTKNPGDTYYECYLGHLEANGANFFDQYNVAMWYGAHVAPRRVLEIGTRTGISLSMLLAGYFDLSKLERVVTVDPYLDGYSNPGIVQMNLKHLGLFSDKIQIVKGRSQDVMFRLVQEGHKFDYILIDGDHSVEGAKQDLTFAFELLDKGGVIVFDDISAAGCNLIGVWDWFKETFAHKTERGFQLEFHQNMSGKGTAWAIAR